MSSNVISSENMKQMSDMKGKTPTVISTHETANAISSNASSTSSQQPKSMTLGLQSSIVETKGKNKEGEGQIHCCAQFANKPLIEYHPDYPMEKYADHSMFGTRSHQNGPYVWQTYRQVHQRCTSFGSGLITSCGIRGKRNKKNEEVSGENYEPSKGVENENIGSGAEDIHDDANNDTNETDGDNQNMGDIIGIFSLSRAEWSITDRACIMYSIVTVPLYDTLGTDAIIHILNHCKIGTVVCSKSHTDTLIKLVSDGSVQHLRYLIQMEDDPQEIHQLKESAAKVGITLFSFRDVENSGSNLSVIHEPPQPDDIATICFTSGTTGVPKGVMLSHKNILADAAAGLLHGIQIVDTDIHISYLPLAHVFERVIQVVLLYGGASIGFYQGEIPKLFDDIAELKPTIFCGVPRVFNRIYDKVMNQVSNSNYIKRTLFTKGLDTKIEGLKINGSKTHWFWDWLVFKKIRNAFGGRVRMMVTGSAPLSEAVMNFLRAAFGCEVIEGYGLTECAAATTLTYPGDYSTGHVGAPLACSWIKLVDAPEMNYTVNDSPYPRGQICVYGSHVFRGYFKDDKHTREAFPNGDGWLYTGDIGVWLPNGNLKVIDRISNMFKLSQGEFISPDKIENIYTRNQFISQVFVTGQSEKNCIIAIVVPDFDELKPYIKSNMSGIVSNLQNHQLLCASPEVKKFIMHQMRTSAQLGGLKSFEMAKDVYLEPEAFSVDNDLLTPTFKLKRHALKSRYETQIREMYMRIQQ